MQPHHLPLLMLIPRIYLSNHHFLRCFLLPFYGVVQSRALILLTVLLLLTMRLFIGEETYLCSPLEKLVRNLCRNWRACFVSYGEKFALECIALKVAMLCCTLLLQKPHPNASSRDFINCLQCQLPLR